VKQSELLDSVLAAIGVAGREGAPVRLLEDDEPWRLSPLRILLAEDSVVNQKLAVALLEKHGHAVTVASDGREALAAIEAQRFDLVLMDVQMPEMDGLDATRAIRARETRTGERVPVVAITARALAGDRERCLEAGMDGYVAKPIHARELFEAISTALAGAGPDRPRSGKVQWDRALDLLDGDPELLRSVVTAALDESPRLMAAIRQALAVGDAKGLNLAAHTLMGTLRHFGDGPAVEHAFRLERMGHEGDLSGAEEALEDLEAGMRQLLPVLRAHLDEEG
jgi:CheY-like chemotaxis protein